MASKIRSYRDLEIWKMARELVIPVHKMTLEKLPKFEMYEDLCKGYDILGRKINNFRQSVIIGYALPKNSEDSQDSEGAA